MIERYVLDPGMFALVAHEDGEAVDYNDHLAAIQAAKVEAVREARKRWAREDAESLAKRDAEVARLALMSAQKAIPDWDCSCGHWLSQYATQYAEQLNKEKGDE